MKVLLNIQESVHYVIINFCIIQSGNGNPIKFFLINEYFFPFFCYEAGPFHSGVIFCICYKHHSLTERSKKREKTKFIRIDPPVFSQRASTHLLTARLERRGREKLL